MVVSSPVETGASLYSVIGRPAAVTSNPTVGDIHRPSEYTSYEASNLVENQSEENPQGP